MLLKANTHIHTHIFPIAWPEFYPDDEDVPASPLPIGTGEDSPFIEADLSQTEQQRQRLIMHLRNEVDAYVANLTQLNEVPEQRERVRERKQAGKKGRGIEKDDEKEMEIES